MREHKSNHFKKEYKILRMFYKLQFFKKSLKEDIFPGEDDSHTFIETINLTMILSLSSLRKLEAYSGKTLFEYSVLTMSNNDKYYLNPKSFFDLTKAMSNSSFDTTSVSSSGNVTVEVIKGL